MGYLTVKNIAIFFFTSASIALTIFSYVTPEFYNRGHISLLEVSPSSVPGSPNPGAAIDGPTVSLGAFGMNIINCCFVYTKHQSILDHTIAFCLGSCARNSIDSKFICLAWPKKSNFSMQSTIKTFHCKISTFCLTLYSSGLSVLPDGLPLNLKPPHYFLPLFFLALILWILGFGFLFASTVYAVDKPYIKPYGGVVACIFLPFGMSGLYLLKRGFLGLLIILITYSIWNLVGRMGLLSEGRK